ncbi:MAG: hypothetical protein LBH42_06400, partial [Treponema sp.]|nr:hypothetical protein [Treponema sp.]
MRIDYITPAFNTQIPQNAPVEGAAELRQDRDSTPNNQHWVAGPSRPGVIVDISPEGWAAYERNKELEKVGAAQKNSPLEPQECETCKNRRYV